MTHPNVITVLICALALASASAGAHGTAEQPVAPPNLTAGNIVHRLTQLGYSDVRVVSQTNDAAEVELARNGQRFALTVSKKLTGPATLITTDVSQTVERGLKSVAGPNLPDRPPVVRPVNPVTPVSPVLR